jgi:hypothetical protein
MIADQSRGMISFERMPAKSPSTTDANKTPVLGLRRFEQFLGLVNREDRRRLSIDFWRADLRGWILAAPIPFGDGVRPV